VARGGVNLIHVVATSSNSLNWWFGTPLSSPTSEKIGILNTGSQVPYDYGGLVGFRKIHDLFWLVSASWSTIQRPTGRRCNQVPLGHHMNNDCSYVVYSLVGCVVFLVVGKAYLLKRLSRKDHTPAPPNSPTTPFMRRSDSRTTDTS